MKLLSIDKYGYFSLVLYRPIFQSFVEKYLTARIYMHSKQVCHCLSQCNFCHWLGRVWMNCPWTWESLTVINLQKFCHSSFTPLTSGRVKLSEQNRREKASCAGSSFHSLRIMFGMTTQTRKLNLGKEFSSSIGVKHTVWCVCAGFSGTHTVIVSFWKKSFWIRISSLQRACISWRVCWVITEYDFLIYSRYVKQQLKRYVEHVLAFVLKHMYFIYNVETVRSL